MLDVNEAASQMHTTYGTAGWVRSAAMRRRSRCADIAILHITSRAIRPGNGVLHVYECSGDRWAYTQTLGT